MFTAIRKEVSKDGKTNWLSKCDCGNERVVQTALLKSGEIWYCDVIQKRSPAILQCLICKVSVFGRLTAVESTERRTNSGSVIWKCVCGYRNTAEISADSLIQAKQLILRLQKAGNHGFCWRQLDLY